ncbi:MAG: NAD-dependent epimerase/dehydratase family protein, partial [Candidatus Gastranaerophilaceae bacterium]
MNNIFFTGLSGFLGQEFLKYYNSRKDNNFRFVQNPIYYRGNGKDYNYAFSADDFSENIDILVHAGAFTPKKREQMEDVTLNLSNVINTDYLLKNLPNIPKKIIYISTVSVYSPTKNVINEETPLGGDSVYGLSKLMCEKIIQNYCIQNEIPYQILRLSVIYGN